MIRGGEEAEISKMEKVFRILLLGFCDKLIKIFSIFYQLIE
jgi:hypothetical protein